MAAQQRHYGATAPIMAVTYDHRSRAPDDDDANYYDSYQSRPLIATTAANKQQQQPEDEQDANGPVFRDVGFAVAFYLHLLVMLYLGLAVAPAGYQRMPTSSFNWTVIRDEIRQQDDEHSISEQDFQELEMAVGEVTSYLKVYPIRILLYLVVPVLFLAFVASLLTTATVIQPCPRTMVYSALLGSFLGTALVLLCVAVPAKSVFLWLVTVALLSAVAYYIRLAWRIVPFAAMNLKVALQAVGRNWGVYLTALVFVLMGCLWNLYWLYVLLGVSASETLNDNNTTCTSLAPHETRLLHHDNRDEPWGSHGYYDDDMCGPNPFVFLALLLSLYWTWTVLLNTIQTTIAGVVATWCFVAEEANQCCSPAVSTSLFRSLTYSFGSICFGSLFQAVVSVLRFVVENARNRHNEGGDQDLCGTLCYCVLECLVRCLDEVLDYFNRWAYCYVGIYGFSYLESGKKVIELFRARGWTSIISDNLVGYTLGYVTFLVAIVTGLMGVALERILARTHETDGSFVFGPIEGAPYWAFGVSFLVGLWVGSVMMNVVQGAVNALIVCWADSPAKLEYQHPVLTMEMADAWDSVFPEAGVRPLSQVIV